MVKFFLQGDDGRSLQCQRGVYFMPSDMSSGGDGTAVHRPGDVSKTSQTCHDIV